MFSQYSHIFIKLVPFIFARYCTSARFRDTTEDVLIATSSEGGHLYSISKGKTVPTSAAVENTVENVYPRQCQMNLRRLKSMFLMRLI
jgi:hypothetical protein